MATAPQYAATPLVGTAALSAANTLKTGAGAVVLATAGTNGSRFDKIICRAVGTTTAGMLRFFVAGPGGADPFLIHEEPVSAATPSATVAGWGTVIELTGGLALPANWTLQAATEKAEGFDVTVFGGNF